MSQQLDNYSRQNVVCLCLLQMSAVSAQYKHHESCDETHTLGETSLEISNYIPRLPLLSHTHF